MATKAANIYAKFLKHAFAGDVCLAALAAPAGLAVTVVGTAGSTHYTYEVTATNANGETVVSTKVGVTTGNATLSATNHNKLTWDPEPGATGYKIYGRTTGSLGLIATITSGTTTTYNDTGGTVGAAPPGSNTTADDLRFALLKSTYTPNLQGHEFWSTVSTDEITGTGYTAGGATMAGSSVVLTAADTWGTARANTHAYIVGDVVRPATANGYLYRCVVAGTSSTAPPSFPTDLGKTVTDGTVTWATMGDAILVVSGTGVSWPTATFSADYGVIYVKRTLATNSPLIALETFGTTQSPAAQTYDITPDAHLGWFIFSPPS